MRYDLIAIGETLIDFISRDFVPSLQFAGQFATHLGGEPINVASNVARLGGASAVVTKVGADGLGAYAVQQLELAGVNTELVVLDPLNPTSIALVTRSVATPDFLIHRGADANLRIGDLPDLVNASWVHTSAFALSRAPMRDAVLEFIRRAKRDGASVSFDPNYHPHVWGEERPEAVFSALFPLVDVVKASEDDCARLCGQVLSVEEGIRKLQELGASHVIMTAGSGPVAYTQNGEIRSLPIPEVDVRDVTGAGDAFWSGFITATLRDVDPTLAVAAGIAVANRAVQSVGPFDRDIDPDAVLADAKEIVWSSRTQQSY